MANYLATDTDLTSVANAIRTKGGTSSSLSFPTGFVSAIQAIQTGADCPTFTVERDSNWQIESVTCDKTFSECDALIATDNLSAIIVNGDSIEGYQTFGAWLKHYSSSSIEYYGVGGAVPQIKISFASNGTITAEDNPIPSKSSSDLTASGATVTAPAGYYESNASKSVASGTEGTPTATKGTVSNHSVTVTPSVTNTAGYISGGTHTGTGVTVTASELESGYKEIAENGFGIDVTGYSAVNVIVPTGFDCPIFTITRDESTEEITAVTCNKHYYECINYKNAGNDSVIFDDQLYEQHFGGTRGTVYENRIDYYGGAYNPYIKVTYYQDDTITWVEGPIPYRYSADLTANNLTVTAPAGYYASNASKTLSDQNLTAGNIKKNVSIFGVMGDLEGITCPIFTLSRNGNNEITTIICNISSSDCIQYYNNTSDSSAILRDQTWEETYGGNVNKSYADDSIDYYFGNTTPLLYLRYYSNGTITWQENPIASRSSSDLTASNLTVNAPAGYYASAASKTLTDSNLTAANIKKNVTIFGVTGSYEGSGGGGGLVYETGTYTPASDIAKPTISFTNTHTTLPMYWAFYDSTGTYSSTGSTNHVSIFENFYEHTGIPIYSTSSELMYAVAPYRYRSSANSTMSGSTTQITHPPNETGTSQYYYQNWCTTTGFIPNTSSSTRYWKAGRTYKWIAIWAPTT